MRTCVCVCVCEREGGRETTVCKHVAQIRSKAGVLLSAFQFAFKRRTHTFTHSSNIESTTPPLAVNTMQL